MGKKNIQNQLIRFDLLCLEHYEKALKKVWELHPNKVKHRNRFFRLKEMDFNLG
jgi:hypothetical protein